MKSAAKLRQWFVLFLCVVMAAGALAQTAAAYDAYPTQKCTNVENEGIEYYVQLSGADGSLNEWREDLDVQVVGDSGAQILGMEIEVTTDATRYQCTEIAPGKKGDPPDYSCNSVPTNAVIKGVLFRYVPSVTEDTKIQFVVKQLTGDKVLLTANAVVSYPPIPCDRNELKKNFVAADGKNALIFNTDNSCVDMDHDTIIFKEQEPPYALVNIIYSDQIVADRIRMSIPETTYSYDLTLRFTDAGGTEYEVYYKWDATMPKSPTNPVIDASALDGLTNADLPLTLTGGDIVNISTTEKDIWGNDAYPTVSDLNIKFWYENTTGTLGYENSLFHFERDLSILFAPYCTADHTQDVPTGVAYTPYDPCQSTQQMFNIDFLDDDNGKGIYVPKNQTQCDTTYSHYCTDVYALKPGVHDYSTDHKIPNPGNYRFITRKCRDSACAAYTTTSSYVYSLTFSDALSKARTYKYTSNSSGSNTLFKIAAYDDTKESRPFSITGARFVADGPGTYVVFGFVDNNYAEEKDLKHYAVKFYITVNATNELTSCYTLANNGYFRAYWNDCLSHKETQLLPFEHIPDTEEAWVRNTTPHGVHFPYVAEWSYTPQKLEIASLNCRFEALSAAGRPADGYCHPDDVYVPPYTKVTITGGTFYLEERPGASDPYVAYMREDTLNISHLFLSVQVKECENVRQIPNTGITLRSPIDVQGSVEAAADPATSYAFTGNALQIPAIGLGDPVVTGPIPIVHVYYQDDSADLGWDLSTLGNYVGELEGGSYIPYGGNSVLTGHYYSGGVFVNLANLNYEDEIIIYANDGFKYIYKVVEKFIADPSDVYEMFQQVGERSLTLVTCENYNLNTNKYERRFIIRAVIDSVEAYEKNW